MPRDVWDVISPEARAEFNRRLKAEGKPAGRWGADETAVQRLFGKELLVLLWAVEQPDVKPEEIAVAIRNWLGLKPEERWWLYTMTAAATGLAHQKGMGWRDALRRALCFGTRADTFHLGTVAGRGSLEPKVNEAFTETESASRAKSKRDRTIPASCSPRHCRLNDPVWSAMTAAAADRKRPSAAASRRCR